MRGNMFQQIVVLCVVTYIATIQPSPVLGGKSEKNKLTYAQRFIREAPLKIDNFTWKTSERICLIDRLIKITEVYNGDLLSSSRGGAWPPVTQLQSRNIKITNPAKTETFFPTGYHLDYSVNNPGVEKDRTYTYTINFKDGSSISDDITVKFRKQIQLITAGAKTHTVEATESLMPFDATAGEIHIEEKVSYTGSQTWNR